ncbi:hypothetical protein PRIPAC_70753, partial [Pristionchus pacificus]
FQCTTTLAWATMDLTKALKLLESQDARSCEDAKRAIVMQLDQGNGIKQVVAYYAYQRSERALELLCAVREPHDKVLMNELADIFPRQQLNTIILLGQMLQQGPSWVPKIAFHPLFKQVANYIMRKRQRDRIVVEDIAVILFIAALIPVCSALNESILKTLSQVFIMACEQLRLRLRSEKPRDDIEEVHLEHFHYGVRQYFMVLYGVYPNYFVSWLKEYFMDENDEAKQKIYRSIIEPMLTQIRLHPGLFSLNRKSELHQQRWHNKEAHDFLDEAKKIMFGMIPPSGELRANETAFEEDTSTVMSDVYRVLFPSKSSGTTSTDAWEHSEEMSADDEVKASMMSRIETPPGTRSHTPKGNRDVSTLDQPMVLDGKRRRSTGPSETGDKGRKSFRATIGKIFTRSNTRMNESFHEEAGVEGERRNSEMLEEAEDAMDAIDAERVETPHTEASVGSTVVVSPASLAVDKRMAEEARAAARSLRGSMRNTTPQKGGRSSVAAAAGAAAAALLQTTPAASEDDGHGGVSRSRSTSFLTTHSAVHRVSGRLDRSVEEEGEERASATTDRSEHMGSNDNMLLRSREVPDVGPISESLPETHFTIRNFFSTMNRQRFASECPPVEADAEGTEKEETHVDEWMEQRKVFEDLKKPAGEPKPAKEGAEKGAEKGEKWKQENLKRTFSLPTIVNPEKRKRQMEQGEQWEEEMTTSGGGAGIPDDVRENLLGDPEEPEKKKTGRRLKEIFPYLVALHEPCKTFYDSLEDDLERNHERNREMYMKESANFHAKLKEMNMADRLPGKIYDDLGHILKGLPVEKQRDMLQARLSLVNQHLLYERSCRLLHSNRNRRLFGRIKQQKVYESELQEFREKEVRDNEERKEMIKAMSDYRKQLIAVNAKFEERNMEAEKAHAIMEEEKDALVRRAQEAEHTAKQAMADREKWRAEHDALLRRAEDAQVELQMMEDKFETARRECAKQQAAVVQLEQQTDDMLIAERRRREEGGGGAASPDWTGEERARELERELEKSRTEIERMRREMETLTLKKEESERALKHETNKGHEMRYKLDRSAKLLNEQKEAAEQKYISLQMVVRRQEEYIAELFSVVEEAEERRRKDSQQSMKMMEERENGGGERRERSEDDSSLSEPIRSPPRRSVLPDTFVSDEVPRNFFLIDPLRASAEAREMQAPSPTFDEEDEIVLPMD